MRLANQTARSAWHRCPRSTRSTSSSASTSRPTKIETFLASARTTLESGRTFSAGIASEGYLEQAAPTRVTIVGEPVGDYLEFWAEGGLMPLPVSKAVLLPATEQHNYTTGCPEPDCHIFIRENPIRIRSLEPDIAAPLTYADYRAGRDPALAAVYEALRR